MRTSLLLCAAALLLGFPSSARQETSEPRPVMQLGDLKYYSWAEYVASDAFRELGLRCGIQASPPSTEVQVPSDCSSSSTSILPQYEPQGGTLYEIPVVVHIIEHTNGDGQILDGMVLSQIDVLNEDFRALAGSLGEDGNDAVIQFYLAEFDPQGNPTTGITRTVNNEWFEDNGNYWDTLAWDTNKYLNIYTNNAGGFLGYVPSLPQGGLVGDDEDRVVVLWSAFGRNSPIGPPYHLGRTATHEVGHYFGLNHTFSGGCSSPVGCYSNGDLICDTNPEASPVFGCPTSHVSCGTDDPYDNYMDYSDDICYERFTPEQVNRMRCTLENYRGDLPRPSTACPPAIAVKRNAGTNPDCYSATPPFLGGSCFVTVFNSNYRRASVIFHIAPANQLLGGGQTLLVDTSSAFLFSVPLVLPLDSHSIPIPNDPALCGLTAYTQAILVGITRPWALSNAYDLTAGSN
jgi:hypothetical protein